MKILVPVDDSDFARKALKQAVSIALAEKAEIHVLSIVPTLLMGAGEEFPKDYSDRMRAQADQTVQKALESVNTEGITIKGFVEHGRTPADGITTYANENNVDLIVMGHRGQSDIVQFVLGSNAKNVVTHAACSVLIVK